MSVNIILVAIRKEMETYFSDCTEIPLSNIEFLLSQFSGFFLDRKTNFVPKQAINCETQLCYVEFDFKFEFEWNSFIICVVFIGL